MAVEQAPDAMNQQSMKEALLLPESDLNLGTSDAGIPSFRAIASRLVGASAIYGLSNLGVRALNFFLLPVYTHYLTPADYGAITLAETVALFLLMILGCGFDSAIQRLYFEHVDRPEELSSFIGSVFKFALSVEIAAIALTLLVGPFINWGVLFHSPVPFRFVAIAVATASATQFFQYRLLLFQAEHRAKAYALLAITSFVITSALSIGLMAGLRLGAAGVLEGKLAGSAVSFLLALFLLRHAMTYRFKWEQVWAAVRLGAPVVPHMLMAGGLIAGDRFIIGHYRSLNEVGLYAVAYSFGMIMSLVTMSLQQAWAPIYYSLARNRDQAANLLGKACSALVVGLAAIACFGVLISEDVITHFLNVRYHGAAHLVPWIIGAYFAHSLFSLFSLSAMQAKKTHWLMAVSFLALVVNLGLDFALIPRWGMYGAAYATAAAYPIEALAMYLIGQRIYALKYNLVQILAAVAIFIGALTVTQISWSASHRIPAIVIAGIVCVGLLVRISYSGLRILMSNRRAVA